MNRDEYAAAEIGPCCHQHTGHADMLFVDDACFLFQACVDIDKGGRFCGNAKIYWQTTPKRAAAVRRAGEAYFQRLDVRQ